MQRRIHMQRRQKMQNAIKIDKFINERGKELQGHDPSGNVNNRLRKTSKKHEGRYIISDVNQNVNDENHHSDDYQLREEKIVLRFNKRKVEQIKQQVTTKTMDYRTTRAWSRQPESIAVAKAIIEDQVRKNWRSALTQLLVMILYLIWHYRANMHRDFVHSVKGCHK